VSLTQERLKQQMHYDPETGEFTRRSSQYRPDRVGCKAGSLNQVHQRIYIAVGGKQYFAHRLAWLYMTGAWPADEIDHINGNGLDNSFANLRECDSSQNKANTRLNKRSRTGLKGVVPHGQRFRAFIQFRGERQYLGVFDTPQEANAAYARAARDIMGEFARAA
jgi:hypothetical protein